MAEVQPPVAELSERFLVIEALESALDVASSAPALLNELTIYPDAFLKSSGLKRVVIADVLTIAVGFVIRAYAGAAAAWMRSANCGTTCSQPMSGP